ncbi:hypothetical protein [Phenylobacterium sp.]|uniref:hypothetical protein n=1 Tax=Phenylobacterium sp. TaxID=1871053 RepID=UPI002F3FB5AA
MPESVRGVAADLEAIFPPFAEPASSPGPAQVNRRPPAPRLRDKLPLAGAGALVAAGLAGVAIGVVYANRPAAPGSPPTSRAIAASPLQDAMAKPPVVALTAEPPPAAAAQPRHVKAAPVQRVGGTGRPAGARFGQARKSASRCGRLAGAARARCAYPMVLAADRRLRRAYVQAAAAGVPHSMLASYRDRWAGLRRGANSDPERTIGAYRQMTRELTRLRQGVRS